MRRGRIALVCLLVVLAGCSGGGGGPTNVTASAQPAAVSDEALAETGFEPAETRTARLEKNGSIEITGDVELQATYRLNATTHYATYDGPEGTPTPTFAVYSVPLFDPVENVETTVNPVDDLPVETLVERVQSRYGSLTDVEHVGNATATVLGNETTVREYEATASAEGESVGVVVHVATITHEGDAVVAVGIHPQSMDGRATIHALLRGIRHPA